MSNNQIVRANDLDKLSFPEKPPEAEVVREVFKKIKIGEREQELPTSIDFADGSFITIEYRDLGRNHPALGKCGYCEGRAIPNPDCPVCHGTNKTFPMEIGKPMTITEFEAFVQDKDKQDGVMLYELKKLYIHNEKELNILVAALAIYRPEILETVQPAFDEIRQKLLT
jgi:hypothetical protein